MASYQIVTSWDTEKISSVLVISRKDDNQNNVNSNNRNTIQPINKINPIVREQVSYRVESPPIIIGVEKKSKKGIFIGLFLIIAIWFSFSKISTNNASSSIVNQENKKEKLDVKSSESDKNKKIKQKQTNKKKEENQLNVNQNNNNASRDLSSLTGL